MYRSRRGIVILFSFILITSGAFIYGLAIGFYQIFPFDQLQKLKNYTSRITSSADVSRIEETEVLNTSLHRLLVKKVFLGGSSISRPQYITNQEDVVYIITLDGSIIAFNSESANPYIHDLDKVPMRHEEYLNSRASESDEFRMLDFKVSAIHAEKIDDNVHKIYVTHNRYEPSEECVSINVSYIIVHIEGNAINQNSEWQTLFTAEPCLEIILDDSGRNPFPGHMAGGELLEFDQDRLIMSVGSFHRDGERYEESYPMDPSNPYGKFILIDKTSGEYSIYATGVRNAQGLYIDPEGTIWSTDHGPRGGDELNIVMEGNNYGWPSVSYGINYDEKPWPFSDHQGRHDGFDEAAFVWINAIAPSSIVGINNTSTFQLWQGDLLIGSLRDQSIHRLRLGDDNRILYNERIELGQRIRDMTILNDGKIALITDTRRYLIIIDDAGPIYEELGQNLETKIAELERYDQLSEIVNTISEFEENLTASNIFSLYCSSCHSMQENNEIGPHLYRVFDRRVGGLNNFNYSNSLNNRDEYWTPELMKSFLLNPEREFPNSSMQQIHLTESEADSIIQYLMR